MLTRLLGIAGFAALAAAAPALGAERGRLAWIYVEANTGGSSGGHVALAVADTIYHVQQSPEGLYELNRDDWRTFRHLYAGLQNRTLERAELDVTPEDVERAEARLSRAFVAQRQALERRARRALDVAWLEAWRAGEPPPPLEGAGLLAPLGAPDPDALGLRAELHGVLGAEPLAGALARANERIAAFTPSQDPRADAPDADALLELREALLWREALVAIEEAWPVEPAALLPVAGVLAEPLAPAEVEAARRFAATERERVRALLGSRRPDRGRALLLALARHQALARTAQTGRLVLLDPFTEEAAFPPGSERPRPAAFARLVQDLAPIVRVGRTKVLAGDFDEANYNLLEVGAGVLAEYERGARGAATRKLPRRRAPARAGQIAFAPSLAPGALASALGAAELRLAHEREAVAERYRYGVFRRNCVTELVRLLDEAYPEGGAARALGARLEPGAGFSFIPFVFYDDVTERLRVAERETVPSHRMRELARLRAEDDGVRLRLREAVTLSSTIYAPRLRDGRFLFFTDDVRWRRPLLGFANLGYALGQSVVGLAAAPFDGARRLRAAGSGVWYSLPELAFFNIRKGTFEYVPLEDE